MAALPGEGAILPRLPPRDIRTYACLLPRNCPVAHPSLRPVDLADFHVYRADPAVTRHQGFDVFSREQVAAFIAQQLPLEFGQPGQWAQYGIESQHTGRLIGDCAMCLQEADSWMAEIGITLATAAQRQGYAKETLLALLDFLFQLPDFHWVVETVDADNAASIALLESLGFRLEGDFRDNILFKGQWGSERHYAILRLEWEASREQIGRNSGVPGRIRCECDKG